MGLLAVLILFSIPIFYIYRVAASSRDLRSGNGSRNQPSLVYLNIETMVCQKCRTQNQEGAQFCTSCGNSLAVISPAQSSVKTDGGDSIRKKILKIIGAGIIGIVLVFTIIFVVVTLATSSQTKIAEAAFNDIKSGNLSAVYQRTSEEFQKDTSFSAFESFVSQYPILKSFKTVKITGKEIKTANGVSGTILNGYFDDTIPFTVSLIKENKEWKIYSLKLNTNSDQQNNNSKSPAYPISPTTNPVSSANPELAKYDLDTNGNAVPDFVETALGWDPTVDKCKEQACGKSTTGNESVRKKNILIILDSSGSMAESFGGEQKMTAAKTALRDYVNSLQNNMNVSLMVYGHKGSNNFADQTLSCRGIDILYPLGPIDKTSFTQAVSSFQPTGWTPIGNSLRKARNEVFAGHESESNYIILVTDGIETCNSDPIGAVRELEASSIKPIVSVIGLAINSSDKGQLQQIADAGGGKYYSANNSKELNEALLNNNKDIANVILDLNCLNVNYVSYNHCLTTTFLAAYRYLNGLSLKSDNPAEKNKITEVLDEIRAKQQESQNTSSGNYQGNYDERKNELDEQLNQQKNLYQR